MSRHAQFWGNFFPSTNPAGCVVANTENSRPCICCFHIFHCLLWNWHRIWSQSCSSTGNPLCTEMQQLSPILSRHSDPLLSSWQTGRGGGHCFYQDQYNQHVSQAHPYPIQQIAVHSVFKAGELQKSTWPFFPNSDQPGQFNINQSYLQHKNLYVTFNVWVRSDTWIFVFQTCVELFELKLCAWRYCKKIILKETPSICKCTSKYCVQGRLQYPAKVFLDKKNKNKQLKLIRHSLFLAPLSLWLAELI